MILDSVTHNQLRKKTSYVNGWSEKMWNKRCSESLAARRVLTLGQRENSSKQRQELVSWDEFPLFCSRRGWKSPSDWPSISNQAKKEKQQKREIRLVQTFMDKLLLWRLLHDFIHAGPKPAKHQLTANICYNERSFTGQMIVSQCLSAPHHSPCNPKHRVYSGAIDAILHAKTSVVISCPLTSLKQLLFKRKQVNNVEKINRMRLTRI